MSNEKLTTSQLEERLLEKELKEICGGIDKVGEQLRKVFSKYEPMKGSFAEELQKFLVEHLRLAQESYAAGYTTKATAYVHPDWIPNELKKAILRWAVNDFLKKVYEVNEMAHYQEQ